MNRTWLYRAICSGLVFAGVLVIAVSLGRGTLGTFNLVLSAALMTAGLAGHTWLNRRAA